MRRLLSALAALLLAVVLAGCSGISGGIITAKVHEPATTRFCSVKPLIICPDDEDWRFDLRDGETTGFVYVSREDFDRYEVGDYLPPAP